MKNFFYTLILFSMLSCNDDNLIDLYSSNNRSEELFGNWQLKGDYDEIIYLQFNEKEYIVKTGKDDLSPSKFLWYNDESKVYYIRNGNGLKNDSKSSYYFKLSSEKDTLKTSFGDDIWETYIKINQ